MTANVGESVLFIHSQANRDSRPHLIGGHGDYVWEPGSFADPPAEGLETWFIAAAPPGRRSIPSYSRASMCISHTT